VLSKYGKVVLTKTGTDDLADKTKYNGAQFQVYECTKTASGATLRDSDPSTQTVDPLTIGGEKTFTTAGQGTVEINYLRANDYVNGAAKSEDQLTNDDYYCLVETKAPEGYSLQADPLPFRVLAEKAEKKAAATSEDPAEPQPGEAPSEPAEDKPVRRTRRRATAKSAAPSPENSSDTPEVSA